MKEDIRAIASIYPDKFELIESEGISYLSIPRLRNDTTEGLFDLDDLSQDDVDIILKEVGIEYELYHGGKLWHYGVWKIEKPFDRPSSEAIYETKRIALEAAVKHARKLA